MCRQVFDQLPTDIQSRIAQLIDTAETKVSVLIQDATRKMEELTSKQSEAFNLAQDSLHELCGSTDERAQRIEESSLSLEARVENLLQAHRASADSILQHLAQGCRQSQNISNLVTSAHYGQASGFQRMLDSNQRSSDIVLRKFYLMSRIMMQQEARSQAQSSHIIRKLETVTGLLGSFEGVFEDIQKPLRVVHSPEASINAAAQRLFANLVAIWEALSGALRELMQVAQFLIFKIRTSDY